MYHFHIRRKHNHRSKRALDDVVEDLKRDERVGRENENMSNGFSVSFRLNQ